MLENDHDRQASISALACAALSPGLRSVLIFDTSPNVLQSIASDLAGMLRVTTGRKVVSVLLGSTEDEDALWGTAIPRAAGSTFGTFWQDGLLFGENAATRLVVIPDLSRISVPSARACVMLMGADIAQLERHGRSETWRPDICWLASCPAQAAAHLSSHLLDRFALRLRSWEVADPNRPRKVLDYLDEIEPTENVEDNSRWHRALEAALSRNAPVTGRALKQAVAYGEALSGKAVRRQIALLRLAMAHARLEGASTTTAKHVDWAANVVGLVPPVKRADEIPIDVPEPTPGWHDLHAVADAPAAATIVETAAGEPQALDTIEPIYRPDEPEIVAHQAMQLSGATDLYPEDAMASPREPGSLRLPPHTRAESHTRGHAVGVERTVRVHDLALISTIMEAAKFQRIRKREHHSPVDRLLISPADLRSYRRARVPEQMLILVLDYTCLASHDWQSALLPYLTRCYVERASICLIQVGARDAANELCAHRIMADSLLGPAVGRALETSKGRATPLAHGLELARQTARDALRHGRTAAHRVELVVLSDGRGNVPLEASLHRRLQRPVRRQGIEDALRVAAAMRSSAHIRSVWLSPPRTAHGELPESFATALGATLVEIGEAGEAVA